MNRPKKQRFSLNCVVHFFEEIQFDKDCFAKDVFFVRDSGYLLPYIMVNIRLQIQFFT